MSIAKITNSGLAGVAVSVAILWGCLLSERMIVSQTFRERARVLQTLEQLRNGQPRPASAPAPRYPGASRQKLG